MNFEGFDKLVNRGRFLLREEQIGVAHDSFHDWVEDISDWIHNKFPDSGLTAKWNSLGTSQLVVGGLTSSYDMERWHHFHLIIEKRLEWLYQLSETTFTKVPTNYARRGNMPSIFLCHSSKDKFFVRKLADQMRHYHVYVWIDEAELQIGDSLLGKIGEAIEDVDYVGVVLSSNSIESEWVQRELRLALQKEFKERKVVVLPLLLEPVDVPPFLRDKLYADFTSPEKFDDTFPKVLKSMGIPDEEVEPVKAPEEEITERRSITSAERKLADFEDLAIIDIDETRSFKPDPEKLLYHMYMKLSNSPPLEWEEIFEAERRFPRHTMWRRAWIEGGYVVIHCVPDELEKYHMRDLRHDVQNSNEKYRRLKQRRKCLCLLGPNLPTLKRPQRQRVTYSSFNFQAHRVRPQ